MQLHEAVELYLLERVVSVEYANQLRHRVGRFAAFAPDVRLSTIEAVTVNRWLGTLLQSELAPKTVRDYRAALLAVWAWAFGEAGLTESRPERIRRIRVPEKTPTAWTLDEVRKLLATADKLSGTVSGIAKRIWWTAFIRIAFSTGFRLGDVLRLKPSDIRGEWACRTQRKTGRTIARKLTPKALESVAELLKRLPDDAEYVFTWPHGRTSFFRHFGRLVKATGIRHGTSRYLRRSPASYVELAHPGHAKHFLGHRTDDMVKAYLDPSIVCADPIMPPEL